MATLAEILLWFMTGKKPTQAQFWVTLSSFYHKLEKIPVSAIEGLTNILNSKADKGQFDAHKTAEDAHKSLFDLKADAEALTNHLGDTAAHADLFAAKADAQALLNHIQATFDSIGLEAQTRANNDDSLQFEIDDSKDLIFQAQEQINAINLLLTSNDINLDTVQEIVDAIKTVQTSLSTILVDDFTTGGVTKAATAERVKVLKILLDLKQDLPKSINSLSVTGTYNIDWNNDTYELILTGNTILTESNLPATGTTKVISVYVSGAFALTLPTNWATNIVGTFSTTKLNQLVVEYRGVNKYWLTITQPN